MKKIIITITSVLLFGCSTVPKKEYISKLQNNFDIVYGIDADTYVCIDSIGDVYDVDVSFTDGDILSKIKINK